MIQILCMLQIFHTWVPQQPHVATKKMKLERTYHGVRIQVVSRLQRHPDRPRSHHTLYHRFHWCRLQPYPWLVHPCWSKCRHPHGDCNNLESHQLLEAWRHHQCKRLMEERRTRINNNFSCIWSWKMDLCRKVSLILTSKVYVKLFTSLYNQSICQIIYFIVQCSLSCKPFKIKFH